MCILSEIFKFGLIRERKTLKEMRQTCPTFIYPALGDLVLDFHDPFFSHISHLLVIILINVVMSVHEFNCP